MKAKFILGWVIGAVAACTHPQTQPLGPAEVKFQQEAVYPEGVAYHQQEQSFLVSSLRFGRIGKVTESGVYTPFIEDTELVSSLGVHVDAPRNRVVVCNADPGTSIRSSASTQGTLAGVGIYNLNSGARISYVNLGTLKPGTTHLANDAAIDAAGNIYVTDSFSPTLYKIDAQGTPSVWLEDERLGAPAGAFGLNGIAYHPDGYLLVAKYNEGLLFKVPLSQPQAFQAINISRTLVGCDGLVVRPDGKLVVVANAASPEKALNTVFLLSSNDNWASAAIEKQVATGEVFPTTATLRGTETYVLYAQLDKLFGGQQPPAATFSIKKAEFK